MCVLCRALGNELNALWHSDATAVYGVDGTPVSDAPTIAYATWAGQGATGDVHADGLLSGSKWSGTVTYSFTDSPSDYAAGYGYGEPLNGFAKVTVAEQNVVNTAMSMIGNYTNVVIQRIDGALDYTADIRIARSAEANPTAYAYYPGNSPAGEGGDVWIGTTYTEYNNPTLGDYGYLTHLHELGHSFGLKHSQESGGVAGALPADRDALEFTVMSYRSYVGGSTTTGYTNEQFGYPQSYMMNDIAALQQMYGADFSFNGSDSVYTWNSATGQMSINGVGQGTPGANRVFLTIWDGGGNDTYDMSNYTTGVSIDLSPGSWSITSAAQKAYLGYGNYAQGNVYNAYLYDPDGGGALPADTRSLIENAIGGAGNDTIIGNIANNKLDGRGGNDTLTGGAGDDIFIFHAGGGSDTVTDFTVGGLTDEIYFDFTNVTTYAQAMSYAAQVGANTVFNFGTSGTLTLLNVTLGTLTADDFQYSNPPPSPPPPPPPTSLLAPTITPQDFNNDGTSDILQVNSSGNLRAWMINDGQISQAPGLGNFGTSRTIIGTGDFNGDGSGDILWRDSNTNAVGEYLIINGQVAGIPVLGTVAATRQIAATGDFNGDGTTDLLWRDNSGLFGEWMMSNSQLSSVVVFGNIASNRQITAVGDFNGDGTSDILWRDDNGLLGEWLISNGQIFGAPVIGDVASTRKIVGAGNFNGDGTSDICWRDSNGTIGEFLISNGQIAAAPSLGAVASTRDIVGLRDFNSDGIADVLWRDPATGLMGEWLLDTNGQIAQAPVIGVATTDWQVIV